MVGSPLYLLASIDAVRPVFTIVTGIALLVSVWRLSQIADLWTARTLVGGAVLLGFGYIIALPLREAAAAGHFLTDHASAAGWQAARGFALNGGWLLFGLGMALHAGLIRISISPRIHGTLVSNRLKIRPRT